MHLLSDTVYGLSHEDIQNYIPTVMFCARHPVSIQKFKIQWSVPI